MLELDEIVSEIRQHLDRNTVVDLTQKLVSIPSYTSEGQQEAASALAQFLAQFDISASLQPVEDAGANLIATLPSNGEEPGLLFNGHLDTVPPSSAMPYPPFSGKIVDDNMWGRGTADMKGGVAAMACALAALQSAGIPLKKSVTLTAVAAEERGNLGTAALVRNGVHAEWAVVGEATGLNLVIAHKGVDRYKIIVEGRAAHETMPEMGINAIIEAAQIITELNHTLCSGVKDETQAHPTLGHALYNIGTIQGGTARNMIPERCVFQMSKRWLPGDSPEAICQEIEAVIRSANPKAKVSVVHEPEFDQFAHPPMDTPPDHPLTCALAATTSYLTGRKPQFETWGAFTDGALLQSAGIATVIFGPGDIRQCHTDDEHIPLGEVVAAAEVYAVFAALCCGANDMAQSASVFM